MNTDLSESEAEKEARQMNGDMTKVKKRVKKSEAKNIREGRRHRQKRKAADLLRRRGLCLRDGSCGVC